jgi:hypothetical protein
MSTCSPQHPRGLQVLGSWLLRRAQSAPGHDPRLSMDSSGSQISPRVLASSSFGVLDRVSRPRRLAEYNNISAGKYLHCSVTKTFQRAWSGTTDTHHISHGDAETHCSYRRDRQSRRFRRQAAVTTSRSIQSESDHP